MVRRSLVEHHMLAAGDRVLVGVSGGADSMVLLHLLCRLAPEMQVSLGVAHLNHCLRGAHSDQDAQVVRQTADRLKLPCHVGNAHVKKVKQGLGLSLEEAARRVRYAFFKKIMLTADYNKLALGHHQDDNAEQVLMALLRGAGARGLAGIAPVRQSHLVRPLIHVRRSQIEAYAKHARIDWVSDASNQDLRFVRNRIRHHLLPLLAADYNSNINRQLGQLADVMRTEEEWIDELIATPYADAVTGHTQTCLTLGVRPLRRMHSALVRRLLRRALVDISGTLRGIRFVHIQSIQGLMLDGADGKSVHLPRGIRARRSGDRLEISFNKDLRQRDNRQPEPAARSQATVISPPFPKTVKLEALGAGMRLFSCSPTQVPDWRNTNRNQAFFDYDRLSQPLVLRPKMPGDRFIPLGCKGSQKVKKYFIDHHISRKDRAMTPILADQRHIVWLVGHRVDDRPKVRAETKRVLCAEFFLLDNRKCLI